jgi:hypothetical protein
MTRAHLDNLSIHTIPQQGTELLRGFRTADLVDSSTLPRLAVDNHSGLR